MPLPRDPDAGAAADLGADEHAEGSRRAEGAAAPGELVVGGRSAKLSNITVPVLSVVAEHDHLAPRESTKPLLELVGSTDKEEILLKGGHVSLIAGPNAVKRMWPRLERWLAVRST